MGETKRACRSEKSPVAPERVNPKDMLVDKVLATDNEGPRNGAAAGAVSPLTAVFLSH